MMVWMPTSEASAKPLAYPTVAMTSKVSVSNVPRGRNPEMIHDGETPASSNEGGSYFDWWPRQGGSEWAEYAFEKSATVSEAEVYWFDDTGRGGVRVPASWRLVYKDGDAWKPVETTDTYAVDKDK